MRARRRALMNAFLYPENYLFCSGQGLRKDLGYFFGLQSNQNCKVSSKLIHIEGVYDGTANTKHGTIYIGEGIEWDGDVLKGNPIPTEGHSKLFVELNIFQASNTRDFFLTIIDNADLSKFGKTQEGDNPGLIHSNYSDSPYYAVMDSMDITGKSSSSGVYVAEFDISGVDSILLNFWSQNFSGIYIDILNIWFE